MMTIARAESAPENTTEHVNTNYRHTLLYLSLILLMVYLLTFYRASAACYADALC